MIGLSAVLTDGPLWERQALGRRRSLRYLHSAILSMERTVCRRKPFWAAKVDESLHETSWRRSINIRWTLPNSETASLSSVGEEINSVHENILSVIVSHIVIRPEKRT
jgi:hypothetical protein